MSENSFLRNERSMLGTHEQNGHLQNGHSKTTNSQENDRVGGDSERYVPEPVTGRTDRTTAASRSSLGQQTGTMSTIRTPSPGTETEPANGEVSRSTTQAQAQTQTQILDLASLRQSESLHYFSYLGRLNPKRFSKRCVSTQLTSRQLLFTSTSFVTTNVMDALQERIDEGGEAYECRLTLEDRKELVECYTCVCCVKAVFYHCTKDEDDEGRVAEHPCSCQGSWAECLPRWGILGILSMFLPCLWCYLPCRACEKVSVCCRDWSAERKLRAAQARQEEISEMESSSSGGVEAYEPVNLQRQEALRIQDPYGLLTRGRYVDVGTLNSM